MIRTGRGGSPVAGCAGSHAGEQRCDYSSLTPDACTTFAHFAISERM